LTDRDSVYCWGGGGIVADSEPEDEYAESLNKIQLILDSLNAMR
jgi:para-aminobenzoate synthetase component 1